MDKEQLKAQPTGKQYGGGVAPVGMNGEQLLRQESRALNVLSVLIEQFLGDTMI